MNDRIALEFKGGAFESDWTSPAHHGAGVTSALPLLVHLCAAQAGETLILQDPETNLHPKGQSILGRMLAAATLRGVSVIAESHSEHVLNGIRLELAARGENFEAVLACSYFGTSADNGVEISEVALDRRGRIIAWPQGFFDQAENDLATLLRGGRGGAGAV